MSEWQKPEAQYVLELRELRKELETWKARKFRCGECGNIGMTSNQMTYLDEIAELKHRLEKEKSYNEANVKARNDAQQQLLSAQIGAAHYKNELAVHIAETETFVQETVKKINELKKQLLEKK
jgi:hypothetical protein